jgi:hypothetical protein
VSDPMCSEAVHETLPMVVVAQAGLIEPVFKTVAFSDLGPLPLPPTQAGLAQQHLPSCELGLTKASDSNQVLAPSSPAALDHRAFNDVNPHHGVEPVGMVEGASQKAPRNPSIAWTSRSQPR